MPHRNRSSSKRRSVRRQPSDARIPGLQLQFPDLVRPAEVTHATHQRDPISPAPRWRPLLPSDLPPAEGQERASEWGQNGGGATEGGILQQLRVYQSTGQVWRDHCYTGN